MIFKGLGADLRKHIKDYGMFIALFVIIVLFTFLTDGIFISPRNISNLLNQTGYIAIIAIGMTLVIVIRHIDLSVGFLSGFLGAVAAIAMAFWNIPVFIVIPSILILGLLAGLLTAYPVAKLGIPAFVASLAGWLIYRGALLLVTLKTGTIIIPNKAFNAIGNGFIPDLFASDVFLPEMHKTTLLLGLLAMVFIVYSSIKARNSKIKYNFEVVNTDVFILKQAFIVLILGIVTWILAGYNGLSWTLVIVLVVVAIYNFITKKTVIGRHIYAVGGNPEAAELSGINVEKITFLVFGSMGMLSGLSGMLFASRLQSATTTAGTLLELDAIAAAYIGGVSAAGGVGSVVGSLIGAIVYTSLTSGMNLMGIDISSQYIVRGAVLAGAVIFDVATRNIKK
ncbi:sugar ABC transporter permease [Thiospirochaeta perfilievii]|uniref:Xylose transport system permease protein XylH n=1 Tax=Thiospirochaeta perfilievii TaxID=252967 RepID=A0A5C1Q5G3_9SPIO|nr:sugar ABC transporter permease [Thiospirochaeta perfilievii]QEN03275.1 sugar ABC transporter permease [Thiospirochaeta perfilievii]